MRTFADMVTEMLDMAVPGLLGVVTGEWQKIDEMAHISEQKSQNLKKTYCFNGMPLLKK